MAEPFEPRTFKGSALALPYRLLRPEGLAAGSKAPLVVFLHGAGERGVDNRAQLKWCVRDFALTPNRAKYPCFVAVPQCPAGEVWGRYDWPAGTTPKFAAQPTAALGAVLELIPALRAEFPVDPARVYLIGMSMGGFGTWDALARKPELFAAAVPICGGGDPATVGKFKEAPIWAFHGAKDDVVPASRSQAMVAALKTAGAKAVKYTEYPEVGHFSWTPAFGDAELLPWVFAQRRPG